MEQRIKELRDYLTQKKHHAFRRSVPLDLKILDSRLQVSRFFNKIFAKFQSKTTFSNRNGQISAKFLCAVLDHEIPIILPNEKITILRTLPKVSSYGGLSNNCLDYETTIQVGLEGRRETALESLKSCIEKKDADGIGFLQNVIKIIDAIEKFADIYAEKAKELGRTDIYEIFQRIPKNGAHSLREALQFLRLLQFVQRYDFNGLTPIGRFDQFMFPYFVADLNAENLDYNQALELIEEYFLNLNKDSDLFFGVQKGDNGQSLVLGGLDSNRFNAYNQLSEICLKASLELCLIDPKINLRVNKETPIEIFELGTELTKCGLGFPAIFE